MDVGKFLAFDKKSGKLAWQSGQDRAGFSSPIAVKFKGETYAISFNTDFREGCNRHNWTKIFPAAIIFFDRLGRPSCWQVRFNW